MPPPSFTWQALDGQGWPASPDQERAFAEDLRRAAKRDASPSRPAATCVLNALRCGLEFAELLDMLPGAPVEEMAAAYNQLESRLAAAATSWGRVVERPTLVTLTRHSAAAELILPVPVHRILLTLGTVTTAEAVVHAVESVTARVRAVTANAHDTETVLAALPRGDRRGIQLGRRLHDVAAPGLWSDPYFLPRRIGDLSATRAADLRGDPR